ncbi:MAG: diadenylate cyclase [Planctomycetota bacterium]
MPLDPKTIVQVLILTMGIHVVLSFLRTTRGSGLIRGVAIALFVIFGGLLGLARWQGLAELEFIVQSVSGFVVVILAIVFQPELRRGIVSIGDSPLLRRVIGSRAGDAVDEVAAACVSMAKRKQGALIAFERQTSLDPYAQTAVRIDGRVQKDLLDSIFHSGAALHDGAVIIRDDRIACAMAILPLSDNDQLASSVGTRHRAALGLTEETDAVVVAVSEETGLISVFQGGTMERRVMRDELADVLRARLGGDDLAEPQRKQKASFAGRLIAGLTANPGQKLLSVLLAIGLYSLAFRSVRAKETMSVQVQIEADAEASSRPTRGLLRIVLPSDDLHVARPLEGARLSIEVDAPQAELSTLKSGLGGVLIVDEGWIDTDRPVDAEDIVWGQGEAMSGISVSFQGTDSLDLRVERYDDATIEPSVEALSVEDEEGRSRIVVPLDAVLDPSSLEFNPKAVRVRGPADQIARLREDESLLRFMPIVVSGEAGRGFVERVDLDRADVPDIEIVDDLFLRGRLQLPERRITSAELDVALVNFDAGATPDSTPFMPPTKTVTVEIWSRGLLPEGIEESTKTVMVNELLQFVRRSARVFVDVGRAASSPGSVARIEVELPPSLWREELGPFFDAVREDLSASLRLEIEESDREIVLTRREIDDDDE